MARSMKASPWRCPILLVGSRLNFDELYAADGLMPDKRVAAAELLERVRVLIQRKRGPRKLVLAPAVAGAGVSA
jgi:two-component system response regulator CpxR